MTAKKPQWKLIGQDRDYWFWKRSNPDSKVIYQVTGSSAPPTRRDGYVSLDYLLDINNCSRKNVTGEYRLD